MKFRCFFYTRSVKFFQYLFLLIERKPRITESFEHFWTSNRCQDNVVCFDRKSFFRYHTTLFWQQLCVIHFPSYSHSHHLIPIGFYMYIETSNPRSKGHKAWLKSKEYTPTLGRCLSFWYHMLGQHIGTLNVLTASNGSRSAPIWSLSGLQGPYWRPARVTIRSSVKHNVSANNFCCQKKKKMARLIFLA